MGEEALFVDSDIRFLNRLDKEFRRRERGRKIGSFIIELLGSYDLPTALYMRTAFKDT